MGTLLNHIKANAIVPSSDVMFDSELLNHINGGIGVLTQLGVEGLETPVLVDTETFVLDDKTLEALSLSYVVAFVTTAFNPSASTAIQNSRIASLDQYGERVLIAASQSTTQEA